MVVGASKKRTGYAPQPGVQYAQGMPPQGMGPRFGGPQPQYVQGPQRRGMGAGTAVGMGVGALAAGGLAGYALGGGFSSNDAPSEGVDSYHPPTQAHIAPEADDDDEWIEE
ncbi:uncharacterized protein LOC113507906 [Trichoplusia ni]|uniref:Uncharacterized protein LOC113507906 n=1 Tax=Trichoplusia ni TaxID=7111 RepID=A0A7E5X2N9_TRINI|nr:uncharacterized protein LOC113507906 [Trichoplusia ni]